MFAKGNGEGGEGREREDQTWEVEWFFWLSRLKKMNKGIMGA